MPGVSRQALRPVGRIKLLAQHGGQRVLVVGHSNTLPPLIEALGVPRAPELTESDYDDLFVVERPAEGPARLLHLHYGDGG